MSIAKIVAELVERGEEELAEELLSLGGIGGLGGIGRIAKMPFDKKVDYFTRQGELVMINSLTDALGVGGPGPRLGLKWEKAINTRELRALVTEAVKEMENVGMFD